MSPQTIALSQIDTSGRKRPIDSLRAEAYAASIDAEGLAQPIRVRPAPGQEGVYILVTGGHRLAALELLGWDELIVGQHVIVVDDSEDAAAGLELVENLYSGMTALDRAIFLFEAKQRYDAKRGEARGRKRKDQQSQFDKIMPETGIIFSPRFSKHAAERVGLSDTQIRESVAIAKALDPEVVPQLRGTMIEDNQNELKQLAGLDGGSQRKAVAAIRVGEVKTVAQARIAIGLDKPKSDDPQKRIYADLLDRWSKASNKTKRQFMADAGLVYAENEKA
jgi:hypothetical protein